VKRILFVTTVMLLALTVFAGYGNAQDVMAKVKGLEVVKKLVIEGAKADIAEAKDLGSLYEIVVEMRQTKQILYVTKDGVYLIQGALFDKEGKNLTKERNEVVNKMDISKIPLEDAIVIKKGDGAKKLIMITDVDCPYCKTSYQWLEKQTNYTLYVILFPIEQLHPKAYEKSVKIFCAKDPIAALGIAKSGKDVPGEKCEAGEQKLKKNIAVAQQLGVTGTPLFITDAGMKISGFNQQALEEALKK
jgi:thiol:disulfide interchange protein DsbC